LISRSPLCGANCFIWAYTQAEPRFADEIIK
jgi:hypothetical protein